jgi:hypothetical protein
MPLLGQTEVGAIVERGGKFYFVADEGERVELTKQQAVRGLVESCESVTPAGERVIQGWKGTPGPEDGTEA